MWQVRRYLQGYEGYVPDLRTTLSCPCIQERFTWINTWNCNRYRPKVARRHMCIQPNHHGRKRTSFQELYRSISLMSFNAGIPDRLHNFSRENTCFTQLLGERHMCSGAEEFTSKKSSNLPKARITKYQPVEAFCVLLAACPLSSRWIMWSLVCLDLKRNRLCAPGWSIKILFLYIPQSPVVRVHPRHREAVQKERNFFQWHTHRKEVRANGKGRAVRKYRH